MTAAGMAAGSIGLMQEVADESDEERRRRILAMQQKNLLPNSSAAGAAAGQLNTGYSAALGIS
jgi:hypothetical protein